eukprot:7334564-Prymnesium_polylepis.2
MAHSPPWCAAHLWKPAGARSGRKFSSAGRNRCSPGHSRRREATEAHAQSARSTSVGGAHPVWQKHRACSATPKSH